VASLDRLERLTDLVLVLLNATAPRTLDEIATTVPGYPQSHTARRQTFERDKRILREEGIPVVTEPVEGPEQYGYRIDPAAFYLRDLELEPDEQAALHLAVAGVHLGDPSGRDALAKLGASGVAEARPVAALVPPPALVPLFSALRTQSEVRFRYRGEGRVVAPAILRFHGGRWYLAGWDRGRDAARTFRVDRMEGSPQPGPPGSGALPAGVTLDDAPMEPWRVAGDDEDDFVLVEVDGVEGPRVAVEVGEPAVVARRPDGGVLLRLGVSSFDVLRSWVLGLLDHAEIVEPPSAREAMAAWLDSMGAGNPVAHAQDDDGGATVAVGASSDGVRDAAGGMVSEASGAPVRSHPAGAVRTASARLRRLLAIVSWLADVRQAHVSEIAARFDMSEEEVVHELELAACCGVPPYTPDTLLEIVVTEESVQAFLPKDLARPRRLTPAEGLALAASARTILAVPGSDPDGALGRALSKLDAVLGAHRQLVIDIDAPPRLDDVRALVEAGTQAEIEYHSASTDETTVRVVDPAAVVSLDGHWYLDGFCHRAEGMRRFRVDRIRSVRPLDTPARVDPEGNAAREQENAFVPGPGSVPVTLLLGADARWVADSVPILAARERGGAGLEVTLAIGGTAWLERLLLQLGPHATVVAPSEMVGVGSRAAARLRSRYT
jgi:proteasome accessory factor BC